MWQSIFSNEYSKKSHQICSQIFGRSSECQNRRFQYWKKKILLDIQNENAKETLSKIKHRGNADLIKDENVGEEIKRHENLEDPLYIGESNFERPNVNDDTENISFLNRLK